MRLPVCEVRFKGFRTANVRDESLPSQAFSGSERLCDESPAQVVRACKLELLGSPEEAVLAIRAKWEGLQDLRLTLGLLTGLHHRQGHRHRAVKVESLQDFHTPMLQFMDTLLLDCKEQKPDVQVS